MATIRRRDFAKGMMAVAVSARTLLGQKGVSAGAAQPIPTPSAPLAPMPLTRGLGAMKPLPMTSLVPDAVAEPAAHFFTVPEMATLRKLSSILLPPLKGNPGAIQAETPEFLDFLIGHSPTDRQQMYQSGLDRLDAEARRRFGASFAEIETAQADELLRPWMRTWMTDHPPTEPVAHFVNVAHSDIRTATVNSQAWSEAARAAGGSPTTGLYWFPVDPDMHREGFTRSHAPVRAGLRN